MNRLLIFILTALFLLAQPAMAKTVTLDVQNMTCAICPITIKKALEKVPGVTNAEVHFEKKTAVVQFDPDKTNVTTLTKATTDAGYPSAVHTATESAITGPKSKTMEK